jgi:hypothetical protein
MIENGNINNAFWLTIIWQYSNKTTNKIMVTCIYNLSYFLIWNTFILPQNWGESRCSWRKSMLKKTPAMLLILLCSIEKY